MGGGWDLCTQSVNAFAGDRLTGEWKVTLLTLLKPCILILYINITFLEGKKSRQSVAKTPKFSFLHRKNGGTAEDRLAGHPFFVVANRTLKQQNSHSRKGNTEVRRRLGCAVFGPLGVVRLHLVLMAHFVCSKKHK